jgi:hypothetical protein
MLLETIHHERGTCTGGVITEDKKTSYSRAAQDATSTMKGLVLGEAVTNPLSPFAPASTSLLFAVGNLLLAV